MPDNSSVEKTMLDEVICFYKSGAHDARVVSWLEEFLQASDIFYPTEDGGYFDLDRAVDALKQYGTRSVHRCAAGVLKEWMDRIELKLDEDDYVFGSGKEGKLIPVYPDPADEQFPTVGFFAQIVRVSSATVSDHASIIRFIVP